MLYHKLTCLSHVNTIELDDAHELLASCVLATAAATAATAAVSGNRNTNFLLIGIRERRARCPFVVFFFLAVEVFIIDVYRERYLYFLARLPPLAEKEIPIIELVYPFMNALCQISVSI